MTTLKHSPNCGCCGCDILSADFNLFYKLPTVTASMPPVWLTLRSNQQRRFTISPGNPGESLVFIQELVSQGGGQNITGPVFQTGAQLYIPAYTTPPDPTPIQALPGFFQFVYQILPGGTVEAGFYRVQSFVSYIGTTLSPFNNPALNPFNADWQRYWRNHFTLYDVDGPVDLPVDRFPFELHPGEYLLSNRAMPSSWFAVDGYHAVERDWALTAGTQFRFDFVDDTGDSIIGMNHVSDGNRYDPTLRLLDIPSSYEINRRFVSIFSQRGPSSFWWLFRDSSVDVSPVSNGTEFRIGLGGGNSFLLNPVFTTEIEDSRSELAFNVPHVVDPMPPLLIKLLNSGTLPIRPSSIDADRMLGDKSVEPDINPDCPPRHTCPIIFPHKHVAWEIRDLTIPGISVPDFKKLYLNHCDAAIALDSEIFDPPPATIEYPTYQVSFGIFGDNSRRVRNLVYNTYSFPNAVGVTSSLGRSIGYETNISGGSVRVEIDKPTSVSDGNVRVRVWFRTRYLRNFTSFADPLVFGQEYPLAVPPVDSVTDGFDNFTEDPALPSPNPDGIQYGWSTVQAIGDSGMYENLVMFWELELPRWDGDPPELTLTGQDYPFGVPVFVNPPASNQMHTQPQMITVLTSIGWQLTGYTAIGQIPIYVANGTINEVDLSQLVLRIGTKLT